MKKISKLILVSILLSVSGCTGSTGAEGKVNVVDQGTDDEGTDDEGTDDEGIDEQGTDQQVMGEKSQEYLKTRKCGSNKTIYHYKTQGCCGGTVVTLPSDRSSTTPYRCCKSNPYASLTEGCCAGAVVTLPSGNRSPTNPYRCCGKAPYATANLQCCAGNVENGNGSCGEPRPW